VETKKLTKLDGEKIFDILTRTLKYDWKEYVVLVAKNEDKDPFSVLVATILSQNTNDKNSIKAYKRLKEEIGVDINSILKADINKLEECIKVAGMYRQKARTIKELAKRLADVGGSDFLLKEEPEKVRKFLLSVPGIGKKTADVFLSVCRKAPYFAVDTHAARIAKRWGLVDDKASYDEISRALLELFGEDRAEEAHRLLIALGRRYCKAKNPRCNVCPLRNICPYAQRRL
jgi:endonuclease-3